MTYRNTRDVNLGFGIHDSEYHPNSRKAKVQLLIPEQDLPENRTHYCSTCNHRLDYINAAKKFICYSCNVSYHELYDTPLSSIGQQIRPLQSNNPDERIEPALISFKPNEKLRGRGQNPRFQVTGSIRKARITTNNLALVTEDNIRKELGEDEAYGY
jgi:hypothetical protein